jgi:hypothetical protein
MGSLQYSTDYINQDYLMSDAHQQCFHDIDDGDSDLDESLSNWNNRVAKKSQD